jgi:hypothetical protein
MNALIYCILTRDDEGRFGHVYAAGDTMENLKSRGWVWHAAPFDTDIQRRCEAAGFTTEMLLEAQP